MMPSHPDRVRRNYSACFETGHRYVVMNDTDIAPAIGPTGLRVTWKVCLDCGNKINYTRTQEEFIKELNDVPPIIWIPR